MSPKGFCHICGAYGKLTEEHVPPKGAFNKSKYYLYSLNHEDPFAEPTEKRIRQGGIKFQTLCAKCNNDTGSWYGRSYIDWCHFGIDVLRRSKGRPTLYYLNHIYPLRIIKQVIVMMFSINDENFRKHYPYLEGFVLDKERNRLPPDYKLWVYYNAEGRPRYQNLTYLGKVNSSTYHTFTEFTFPPYGFVLCLNNTPPPDVRMTDITDFAWFGYHSKWEIDMLIHPLKTWLPIPGDYREKENIIKGIDESKAYLTSRNKPTDRI